MGPLAEVRAMGLSVSARGDRLAVEPRTLITDRARRLIGEQRDELLRELREEAGLMDLVERVAAHYLCSADELALMKRLALADPVAARECFEATARLEGVAINNPAPVADQARTPGSTA